MWHTSSWSKALSKSDYIPYSRQAIDEEDVEAVCQVLRSDWLTTGPKIEVFERDIAALTGAPHVAALCNGTAGLHAAMYAAGVGPGDEVIVPAITFAASSNAAMYLGATPIFCDVDPETLLIDVASARAKISKRTKVIVAVDYAGQPADYMALASLAREHKLTLIADACHSIGASYQGRGVGTLADLTVFSFHPVKPVTTGEGGAVASMRKDLIDRVKLFRSHGISSSVREREEKGTWYYEMVDLGFNYRLTDIQAALGSSQLKKCGRFFEARRSLARRYDLAFEGTKISPLKEISDRMSAYHLYVVRLPNRDNAFEYLRKKNIGVNLHYIPVYRHPYYMKRFGNQNAQYPNSEAAFAEIMSLPLFPGMTEIQQDQVINTLISFSSGS